MIALDACTAHSGKMSCIVIEDTERTSTSKSVYDTSHLLLSRSHTFSRFLRGRLSPVHKRQGLCEGHMIMGIAERPGMRDARANRTSAYLRKGGADFFGGRFNGLPMPFQ